MPTTSDAELLDPVPSPEDRLRLLAEAIAELDATRARYMRARQEAMIELRNEGWSLARIGRAAGLNDKSHVHRIISRGY